MKKIKLSLFAVSVLALAFVFSGTAYAHPFNYGAIKTNLSVHGSQISLSTTTPRKIPLHDDLNQDNFKYFQHYFSQKLLIKNKGKACSFKLVFFDAQTIFQGDYTCPSPITKFTDLRIHSELFNEYFADTDHFVDLSQNGQLQSLVFTQQKVDYPKEVKPVPETALGRVFEVAKDFIREGVLHIWTGYDHILFLVSIVLLVRSLKKILILVTTFTIAHSITLILAGLKIVTISPRIVEPLIALTIIYVALRNAQVLLNSKKVFNIAERELTVAGFGLIHGLGFAGALLEADIPKAYFVPSLLFFNIGVEIGQICILILIVPLLMLIHKSSKRREILFGITLTIATVAFFWLLQRVFIN